MTLTPWVPEVVMIVCKKSSLVSFLFWPSNFSRCSFMVCLTLVLACFLTSALRLVYFSTSCTSLWNPIDAMSPSGISCEMILTMLPNLLWASSLTALCFFLLYGKYFKGFLCSCYNSSGKSGLVSLYTIPTGRPKPLATLWHRKPLQ